MQGERNENLFSIAEPKLILCKDTLNVRQYKTKVVF